MGVSETCLRYLTSVDYYERPQLRDVIDEFLSTQLGCHEVEFWSRVMDHDSLGVFTSVLHTIDGVLVPDEDRLILSEEELRSRLSSFQVITVQVPISEAAGFLPPPIHYFAFRHHDVFTTEETAIIEGTLAKLSRDGFRASMRRLYESIHSLLPISKDLTSFLHRCIHFVLVPTFKFEAISIFYYERKTDSLILGATTGIERQEQLGLKRSDIRYFADGESFTSRSFRDSKELVEDTYKFGPLKVNNQGERVTHLQSRIYVPLKRWEDTLEPSFPTPLGVMRAVNANTDNHCHPITVLEMARLRVAVSAIAGLSDRYVRALSILHDQERSTHGYNTDLCTIKYAAENIDRWMMRVGAATKGLDLTDLLTEISYRTRDIIAVQDNMASQLMTVLYHSESTRLLGRPSDESVCDLPYTQVFMRLAAAKKGMSDCFSRAELVLRLGGKAKASPEFIRIPSLAISIGSMYLIVRNIAENAIKYSRKGLPPTLDVHWTADARFVEFMFRDYGIGIPERDRPLVCREGFRGRKAQELQLRGNGLGLAVSRTTVEASGGTLRYMPPPPGEQGSVFQLRVPQQ